MTQRASASASPRLLLLAPPGAGKGTQGRRLAELFGVAHIATGDLLREHVAIATPVGREAKSYMDAGELVPDPLVLTLVLDRIGGEPPLDGFVLDGFPRTVAQAEAAMRWAVDSDRTFHAVVSLEVPTPELIRRLLERGRASGRADDNEVTIAERLRVYEVKTAPLLAFYARRGLLLEIDGSGDPDLVFSRISEALTRLGVSS